MKRNYDIYIDQTAGRLIEASSPEEALEIFLKDLTLDELLQLVEIGAEES